MSRLMRYAVVALLLALIIIVQLPHASYTITRIDTQVTLNTNTSASVKETFTVVLTNASVSQYVTNREDLNLTLSDWQSIIGPALTQHIINPKSGVYNFRLFPTPLIISVLGQNQTSVIITYDVKNVTNVKEIAPRIFTYSFNKSVFNFQNELSGQVLPQNIALTVVLPSGSKIQTVYPPPDSPPSALAGNFTNITSVSWNSQEPLSKFTLTYVTQESLQQEVLSFFTNVYNFFGFFAYIIIAAVVLLLILYTYLKIEK